MNQNSAFIIREGSSFVRGYKYGAAPNKSARDRAREIATDLANDRSQIVELTGGDREIYLRSTRILVPFGTSLHSAVEEWAAARSIDPRRCLYYRGGTRQAWDRDARPNASLINFS